MPEKKIHTPLMKLAVEIRNAAYQKCRKDYGKELSSYTKAEMDAKLAEKLVPLYKLENHKFLLRIENVFIKSIVNQGRDVNFDKENSLLSTFIILCSYLAGKRKKINEWVDHEVLISLLNEVKAMAEYKIDPSNVDLLISEWTESGPVFSHFYYFHYSLGDEDPDVAILKIDSSWTKASLRFYSEKDDSVYNGNITFATKDKTIFINLNEDKLAYGAFLSMLPKENVNHKLVSRFEGYYCSALSEDNGKPVAGKFIAIKGSKDDVEDPGKRLEEGLAQHPRLFNQRLKFKERSLDSKDFERYVGDYEGYWFLTEEGVPTIIRIAFKIHIDGKLEFREYKMKRKPKGYIDQVKKGYMRCSFEYDDDHNYRLFMIFDLTESTEVIDGVYCGQKDGSSKIISGRIRLHRNHDLDWNDIASHPIPYDEAGTVLGPKAEDLKKFFFGQSKTKPSNDFFQPDYKAYYRYIRHSPLVTSSNFLQVYAGDYVMYKMDADKTRVNCYKLNIADEGNFTYSMHQGQTATNYAGSAYYADNCIVLLVETKNGIPHYATYIFWVGTKLRAEIETLSGVYSTISGAAPACGRAILAIQDKSENAEPYYKESKEYWESDPQTLKILNFLSIIENNLIKTPREINKIGRSVRYGHLFFLYACDEKTDNRKFFFYQALENGYRDANRILEECIDGRLRDLEIDLVKKANTLTIEFEMEDDSCSYTMPIDSK